MTKGYGIIKGETKYPKIAVGQERRMRMVFFEKCRRERMGARRYKICRAVVFSVFLLVFAITLESVSLQAAAPKVTVTKKTLYVGGENYQIKFKNLAKTAKVTYKSSNKKVATVSSKGLIQPVAKGSATITITMTQSAKTYTGKIAVTVKNPYISISNKKTKLVASSDYQLIGKAYGFTGAEFTFSSSDTRVAQVEKESGLLHAKIAGKAKITMKDKTSGKSVSFTVTVLENTEENAGDVYVTTEKMSKKYIYTAPKDTKKLTEEEAAKVKRLTDIQKRVTAGASITIAELEEYYTQKAVDSRK